MRKIFTLSFLLFFSLIGFTQQFNKIKECAIQNGVLKVVDVDYNPANGERSIVINGVRKNFYDVYPKSGPDYAQGQSWYINNDSILFSGKPYKKYGLPRILGTTEIAKTGVFKAIGVYVEAGSTGIPQVIYIPVRQGCEFQPYQISCGRVWVEKVSSSTNSMQFTAKTTGLTGNITYNWKSEAFTITSGQGTSNVTVDISNANDGDEVLVTVTVSDAKKCPISSYESVDIVKPGSAGAPGTDGKSKWTPKDRKDFIDSCIPSSKLGEEKGRAYCSCMLEKVEKAHPNPLTVEKELTKEEIDAWLKLCLPKN